jgi:hypothetical protein
LNAIQKTTPITENTGRKGQKPLEMESIDVFFFEFFSGEYQELNTKNE